MRNYLMLLLMACFVSCSYEPDPLYTYDVDERTFGKWEYNPGHYEGEVDIYVFNKDFTGGRGSKIDSEEGYIYYSKFTFSKFHDSSLNIKYMGGYESDRFNIRFKLISRDSAFIGHINPEYHPGDLYIRIE